MNRVPEFPPLLVQEERHVAEVGPFEGLTEIAHHQLQAQRARDAVGPRVDPGEWGKDPAPDRTGNHGAQPVLQTVNPVAALISREDLVAAVSGKRDGHPLARRPRHVIGGQRRRIRERLVEVPDEPWQVRHRVGLHDQLVMVAPYRPGHRAGVLELAVRALGESDAGGDHRPRRLAGHGSHHRRGVDATAELGADREGAPQPAAHGFAEYGAELP